MADPTPLLLTRPAAQSRAFAAALEAALPGRYAPVLAPLIEIVPEAGPVVLGDAQALVFSSANGVAAFAARSPERRLPALCVGAMTAEAARAAGFDARSADGDVEDLARLVIASYRPGAGPILHIRGTHAAGDLLGRLRAAGIPGRALRLYDQTAAPLPAEIAQALAGRQIPAIALFSPRSATLFAHEARKAGWDLRRATAFCLSAAVGRALAELPLAFRKIASEPSREGMIALLRKG